jgi:hypothetical protein
MKRLFMVFLVIAVTGISSQVFAQTAEKSSGVLEMKMQKKTEETVKPEKTRANEYSQSTNIRMVKKAPARTETEASDDGGFSWISPAFTSVRTAESTYQIKATVNSSENIRFINLFVNDQFIKNIIPPVPTSKQMVIDEEMGLVLGANQIKVKAVTVSGKKHESSLEIVYDISSATYYALVIAVQEYDHPKINDLDHPIKDASRFIEVIESDYNFKKENVQFLKNPTKADIIGTLHKMRTQVTPEDNLLIYYAGHGHYDEEMETGYWFPKDANPDNPVDWLPNTDLTNYLNVLKTKHTLLIADACFSGGIFKSRAAFNNVMAIEKLYKLTSRKALTSGTLAEVPDKSVFIEYLIKRLDQNTKKYLPSEQLYSSMKEAVMNNSDNVPQYGTIQNVGDEGGDFIFIRND